MPSRTPVETQQIRKAIKHLMKQRGHQYSDMAKALGVSLVTVRRLMTSSDLSIQRLASICDWLGVELFELLEESKTQGRDWGYYTAKQEEFMAKHPQATYFFLLLKVGMSVDEIRSKYGFTEKYVIRVLRILDDAGFLEFHSEGRIRLKVRGPLRWRPGGAMEKAYFLKFYDSIAGHFRSRASSVSKEKEAMLFRPFETYMTKKTYREMCKEFDELYLKYRTKASFEYTNLPWNRLIVVSGLMALDELNTWERVFR